VNHDQERSFAPLKVSNLSSSKGFWRLWRGSCFKAL
jgi:hypothetical protein